MKQSIRAKRMQRHHNRLKSGGKLNLISLMDIFTILVFFLMVNQSNVEVLKSDKNITIPDSVSEQQPKEALIIAIDQKQILVQGNKVMNTAAISAQEELLIEPLVKELKYHASKTRLIEQDIDLGRPVIIMADKDIDYHTLKRVIASCAEADYRNVSFAVNKVADKRTAEVSS